MAAVPILSRWTIDLASRSETFERRPIGQIPGELPRIDDRYATRPYRYGWYGSVDMSKPIEVPGGPEAAGLFFINILVLIDHATGRQSVYWPGAGSVLQECCFIPRRRDAGEGDGYLVAVVNRYPERRSDLVLLDAQRIEEGPIATARLPFLLRAGVHGNWADATRLPARARRSRRSPGGAKRKA
jgi:carotenoid cleavage dioxygenase